jgi:hypothetical protein
MSTKAQYLQSLVDKFIQETKQWPVPMKEVAKWAVRKGLWRPAPYLVEQKCAQELAEALREEYAYDPQGRKIRLKHAYIDPEKPEQGVLWADVRTAPEKHIRIAFEMRRQQIIGDCHQLKLDIDSYNENHSPQKPIQMSFNFEDEFSQRYSHNLQLKINK